MRTTATFTRSRSGRGTATKSNHLLYAGNNLRRAQEIFAKTVAYRPASQQGSQIRGTPSSGLALGVRRCPLCLPFCSTSAAPACESCVGFASVRGFSSSRSHGGRSSKVGCRCPIGASSWATYARDDLAVAVALASGEACPIAWTTALTSIVASKGTIVIDGRICMVLARCLLREHHQAARAAKSAPVHTNRLMSLDRTGRRPRWTASGWDRR